MKKLFPILLTAILVLSICCACGKKEEPKQAENEQTETQQTEETTPVVEEEAEDDADKTEWEIFLDDYEAFVDELLVKRAAHKEVTTDMVALGEYNEMRDQIPDWEAKYDDWVINLDGTDEFATFEAEYARITAKMAE